jgi:transposase
VPVPWAREGSGFTLMFEAFAMLLMSEMPVSAAGAIVNCHDTRLWRVLKHYVEEAHEEADWSELKNLAIDETSARRGHNYVTNVLDMEGSGRLLFMTPGKGSDTVTAFGVALEKHGGKKEQIECMALDMSGAFIKGTRETFPNAALVFDQFHLMQIAGQAVDEVRKDLMRNGADLKGSLWALRGNEWNLSEEQQAIRTKLSEQYEPLGRALGLRSALQDIFAPGVPSGKGLLREWCKWAQRSKLPSFVALAGTIRRHWEGIVSYFKWRVNSARMEAVNGVIQLAKRRARGFRNFTYFRAIAYWTAGKLDLNLPDLSPI